MQIQSSLADHLQFLLMHCEHLAQFIQNTGRFLYLKTYLDEQQAK